MKPLNQKQQQILAFLQEHGLRDGLPPTVSGKSGCLYGGLKSTSTVHAYLRVLRRKDINRQSGLNRAIRLPGENVARVPLLGK